MSRGPGAVMRKIEEVLRIEALLRPRDEPGWLDYKELARSVYGDSPPSRSQLSAISRAVARLRDDGRVLVDNAPGNRRARRVALSPLAAMLADRERTR